MKLAAVAISCFLFWTANAAAASLQPVGDFDRPIFVTSDPGDPNRLLIVERGGRMIEVRGGGTSEFADLTSLVSCCAGERGLLSIALAPDFGTSGRFYAAYTGNSIAGGAEGDLHVDAFRHGGSGLLREPVLAIGHAIEDNHNGGQLQFGPDGYLYVSTGDGGGSGDPLGSGQSLDTLLGKVLRIDPRPGAVPAYAIPAGNPFAGKAGLDEIWSFGLRNPWRFSFDRLSGDLIVADVGQNEREEVDLAPSPAAGVVGGGGANYGWSCREGLIAYPGAPESCSGASGFTDPVFDYPHDDPEDDGAHGCAITGGYVSRDAGVPELYGRYVYADFCVGQIRSLVPPESVNGDAADDRSEDLAVANPVSFGEDTCGRLYVVSNGGSVYRLVGAAPTACPEISAASPAAPASANSISTTKRKPPRVRLRATSRRTADRLSFILTVRVAPCAGQPGRRVQLNRGGRRIASKRLDERCRARFHLQVARRSTFRALLPATGTAGSSRSRSLAIPSAGSG